MTAIAAFFVLSLLVNVSRDLLYPEYGNVEVWLGFEVTGAAARWTAPIHWAMFAVGAWRSGRASHGRCPPPRRTRSTSPSATSSGARQAPTAMAGQ